MFVLREQPALPVLGAIFFDLCWPVDEPMSSKCILTLFSSVLPTSLLRIYLGCLQVVIFELNWNDILSDR